MPRGRKKAVKRPAPPTEAVASSKDLRDEDQLLQRLDQEVERKSAALRAIRDVEIEHLLTGLRLLRSNVTEEQKDSPVSQFFSDILPNLSIESCGEAGELEMQWKEKDGTMSRIRAEGREICTSLLSRISTVYPDCSTSVPHFGGFEFSSKSVKTCFQDVESLQIRNFALDESSDDPMNGLQDTLRTPGMSSQRLSVGMTPKTVRLPKPGEMLHSVHGSPLGVYQDENLEAITESDES